MGQLDARARSVMSNSLRSHGLWPTRLLGPWDSLGKNTGVGCHVLLQGISRPRDGTHVSCLSRTAGRFFTTATPGVGSGSECTLIQ